MLTGISETTGGEFSTSATFFGRKFSFFSLFSSASVIETSSTSIEVESRSETAAAAGAAHSGAQCSSNSESRILSRVSLRVSSTASAIAPARDFLTELRTPSSFPSTLPFVFVLSLADVPPTLALTSAPGSAVCLFSLSGLPTLASTPSAVSSALPCATTPVPFLLTISHRTLAAAALPTLALATVTLAAVTLATLAAAACCATVARIASPVRRRSSNVAASAALRAAASPCAFFRRFSLRLTNCSRWLRDPRGGDGSGGWSCCGSTGCGGFGGCDGCGICVNCGACVKCASCGGGGACGGGGGGISRVVPALLARESPVNGASGGCHVPCARVVE